MVYNRLFLNKNGLLWTAKCSRVSFSKGSPVKKMMNKIEIYNLNTLKVIISIFNCFFILQLVQTGKKSLSLGGVYTGTYLIRYVDIAFVIIALNKKIQVVTQLFC